MIDKDYFKKLLETHYGVVNGDAPINVQKVRFGDVMFNIMKFQTHLDAQILANEEMIIEYTQEDNTEMVQYCQGKINVYEETKYMLENIQEQIYKKVL